MTPLRILIVDDEPDTVLTLTVLLQSEGHVVRGVHRGKDVLAAAEEFSPDAVLLDIAMPEMNGYEVAHKLRRRFGEGRPLLIAISGLHKKGSDKVRAQIAGFNHHLAKPCDPVALLELLRT